MDFSRRWSRFEATSLIGCCLLSGLLACGPASGALDRATTASALRGALAERDLALAFPIDAASVIRGNEPLEPGGEPMLPERWYAAVLDAYASTSVGPALANENRYEDWQLVSLRIAPCAALAKVPGAETEDLCWPEVRLVLQPVLRNVREHERFAAAFADDRAIHVLHDVPPEVALSDDAASRIRRTKAAVVSGLPVDAAQRAELFVARDTVVRGLLSAAVALRGASVTSEALSGLGLRPESLGSRDDERGLVERVRAFLAMYARPAEVKALTSFSLPEGREPAHTDEWIFLAFSGEGGAIVPEPIRLHSRHDGRVLHDYGLSLTGSMTRDDPSVYDDTKSPADQAEIAESVLLFVEDLAQLGPSIRDRRRMLVPNTSCASCHKMNALRFDFHNLSYLEDRELTISPRVETDVALDLAWVRARLR